MISNLHYRHLQVIPENTGYVDIHDSLTFSFSMEKPTGTHYWNRIQYQTSSGSWSEWGGDTTIDSWLSSDGRYHVKLRGIGNTRLTATGSSTSQTNQFKCLCSAQGDLRISGNIENLLNYSTVAAGNHCTLDTYGLCKAFSSWSYLKYVDPWFLPLPSIPAYGYRNMFTGCSELIIGPEIPATTIGEYGCYQMFSDCPRLKRAMTFCNATSVGMNAFCFMHSKDDSSKCDLERAPIILPATTLADGCYYGMYRGCNKLKHGPKLPATTLATGCYRDMFRNCASLTAAPELSATTLVNNCYYYMFYGCTSLTTAPALPATTLAKNCYYSMFLGCTSLTAAPALPATTLADSCYFQMFEGCTSLATAPALPTTTLADHCYAYMFEGCTSLTTAPALPATTLTRECYKGMFEGCTSLTSAPALPATTLSTDCYSLMFYKCKSLTTAPALPATTLTKNCYWSMFEGCTSLATAPKLPATTLAEYCYWSMFEGCTSLATIPELPAITLVKGCYNIMFFGCTSVKLSETQTGAYQTPYRIPKSGSGTTATDAVYRMFYNTGGTFTGNPKLNTTYYTSNRVV